MVSGFKILGMGEAEVGQWYLGLKRVGQGFELTPMQQEEGDILSSATVCIKLEPVESEVCFPRLKAPWLAMDPDGRWFAWWFEPELDSDEDGEFWACDAPESVPANQLRAALDVLAYYVDIGLKALPTFEDWRQSKLVNPWYGQD